MNDVRDITIARNGVVALVSYENKAPPQLWRVEMVKDWDDNTNYHARLSLRHTFMPKVPVDFAGPSYFGGKDDQFVLCAGKAGDIHIWDRVSAVLLHHVGAQDVGGDLTCIAWNPAAEDPFMFGTGCHDGTVRIWSSPRTSAQGEHDSSPQPHDSSPQPYGTTIPSTITETSSPFDSDIEYHRTDSPVPHLDSDSQQTRGTENEGGSSRERTIVFAAS